MKTTGGGLLLILLAACNVAPGTAAASACRVEVQRPLPLLELYTSEGCSSCPPADRWLRSLVASDAGVGLVALGYHVDYWDHLGWEDRFASPGNAVRQRLRARASRRNVVYTPQAMLGGQVQLDWRDEAELAAAVESTRQSAPSMRIVLEATPDGDAVDARLDVQAPDSVTASAHRIELALYSDGLTSSVRAGENRDVELRHDRVVRHLVGPWRVDAANPLQIESRVALPQERGRASGLVVIVHAADRVSPHWALDLPLSGCSDAATNLRPQ